LTGYLGRAGFGVRVAFCAVVTVLLVLAFRGSGGSANQARGAPPWPAPASVPVGVRTAGLPPPASPGAVVRFAVHLQSVFTLGQVFRPMAGGAGPAAPRGVQATRHDPVAVYLNGSRVTGPPGSVMLTPHQEIVVTCLPGRTAVPFGYAFPPGV